MDYALYQHVMLNFFYARIHIWSKGKTFLQLLVPVFFLRIGSCALTSIYRYHDILYIVLK